MSLSKSQAIDAALSRIRLNRSGKFNAKVWAQAIVNNHREDLAKAITLIESEHPSDRPFAQELLTTVKELANLKEDSLRIGVTGIPGVGKSTFIERLGLDLINEGHRVAVLAVDPTSKRTGGSILGDKTRMEELSVHENAFVRPSPASDALGGVARATMEAILLCEASGYDRIIVETVGVGQSETTVREMVDVFTLLLIGGAGDEVQGIKRGIVEMADLVVVHKSDGDRMQECSITAQSYKNALHLLPIPKGGIPVEVISCSSINGSGHNEIRSQMNLLSSSWKENGWWANQRTDQKSDRMIKHAKELLFTKNMSTLNSNEYWETLKLKVDKGELSSFSAAWLWVYELDER